MSRTLTLILAAVISCLLCISPSHAAQVPTEQVQAEEQRNRLVVKDLADQATLSVCERLLTSTGGDESECRALAGSNHQHAARALSLLSMVALARNDLSAARADAEAALNRASGDDPIGGGTFGGRAIDGVVQSNYASLLLREGRFAEALAAYEAALDDATLSRADIAGVHLNRALCLRALGRYDAARDAYLAHQTWLTPAASDAQF